jgi:tripartite-type tricarboxylate transporter receptor subunit TctC
MGFSGRKIRDKVRISSTMRMVSLALTVIITVLSGGARADWPEHAITIIVPFPAGGATDLLGRLLAEELAPELGQNVIVENRVGAVGNVGLSAAARSEANGYTLLVTTNAVLINPLFDSTLLKTAYDPLEDFAPIAYLGATPNFIVTRPSSGIKSIADLIAKAKAEPGRLTYASPGVGSSSQLAAELFKLRAGLDIRHISFDGSEPAMQGVLSGATDIAAIGVGALLGPIRSGELKALVQTGSQRWGDLADVPTMAEAGIPKVVAVTSEMFLAPARTSVLITEKLARATQQIMQRADIQSKMMQAGILVQYEGPYELRVHMARETSMWKEIILRADLKTK